MHCCPDGRPREGHRLTVGGGEGNSKDLEGWRRMEPGQRPILAARPCSEAENGRFPISVENGSRHLLKKVADAIRHDNVLIIVAEYVDVVYVGESQLHNPRHIQTRESPVECLQKRLELDDVEQHGERVALSHAESYGDRSRQPAQQEHGLRPRVKGPYLTSEDVSKPHHLQDPIHIGHADPIIGVKEVQV